MGRGNPSVYRIHIKPGSGEVLPEDAFRYCVENSILGVGWHAEVQDGCTWKEYRAAAQKKNYSNADVRLVERLYKTQLGDLIWTRSQGRYYLGRVTAPWRYSSKGCHVDLLNVVPCQIQPVRVSDVPGKVAAAFRPSRTFQRVQGVDAYSQLLWNALSSETVYPTVPMTDDVFDLLDSCELEDAANLHLQLLGWMVISSSRRPGTAAYENYLVHPDFGTAVLQVKGGDTALDPGDPMWQRLLCAADRVFLFQAKGNYGRESPPEGIFCLTPSEVRKTLISNRSWMPGTIGRWLGIADGEEAPSL